MADTNSPAPSTTPDRPWLGLAHFTAAERDYFFGREEEVRLLSDRVRRTPLVILYGVSGYGKSSLLGAGLIPSLEEAGFTVNLLRRCYEALAQRPLVDDVIAAVLARHPGARPGPEGKPATLWEFFHRLDQPWFQRGARPVLIFDQFEEIFTRGENRETADQPADLRARGHARDFLEQLSDLIENRPPAALRALLESGTAGERRDTLSRYDFDSHPVRCVLALRDDFLAHLERWRRAMPSMMEHRIELQLLSGTQALEAVFKPGTKRPGQPPIIPRDAAEAIVRRVAQLAPGTPLQEMQAAPSLLSLLCEQLNSTRLGEAEPPPQIGIADVEHRSTHILQQFYRECFASFPDRDREKVRAFVEDGMVSESGHRHPVAREVAEQQLRKSGVPDPAKAFDELIGRRLLSVEEQRGVTLLEITHDVLVPLILESRTERQERWRQEEQERELAAEREKLAAEAIKARRRLWLAIGMTALSLIAVAGAILGLVSWRNATKQRDQARYHEGLAWRFRAEVAKERGEEYPGMLLYAANAIGFDGAGRRQERDDPAPFIHPGNDHARHAEAKRWLAGLPSYLPVWSSPTGSVALDALAVSSSGRHLATGGRDGRLTVWDFSSDIPPAVISTGTSAVFDLSFMPDGIRLMVATDQATVCWDLDAREFSDHRSGAATALAAGSAGELLLAAGIGGDLAVRDGDREVHLKTGFATPAARISCDGVDSRAVAVVPGRGLLVFYPGVAATANAWMEDGWNLPGAAPWKFADATAAALSPDGELVAVGTTTGAIHVWSAATAERRVETAESPRHRSPIRDLAFRADGLEIASAADDGRIRIWRVDPAGPSVKLVATMSGHVGPVARIRYLPGGGLLASCGADGSAKLWNVSGQPGDHGGLYGYVLDGWYRVALDVDPPPWNGRSGFINLPAASPPALWQQPAPAAAMMRLLESAREWPGVIALLPALPEADRRATAADVATRLSADAEAAAGTNRWNQVRTRLGQWRNLGRPANESLERLEREIASLAREGRNFANGEGMDLIWCPAGTFKMGSPTSERDRRPEGEVRHNVTLSHGFWIGMYEVTQAEWSGVMGSNPSQYDELGPKHPVERIDWHMAMEFCRQLTDRERARGLLPAGWEYTLPTEAQWEYACRAESPRAYCYGDDPAELSKYGNFRDQSNGRSDAGKPCDSSQNDRYPTSAPVGSYRPNAWGIHDMHGNVLEWCRDMLESQNRQHLRPDQTDVHRKDPLGERGGNRELRGGSWEYHPRDCRSARGFSFGANRSTPDTGMRVVLTRVREMASGQE